MKLPEESEFDGWLADPLTLAFREYLRRDAQSLKDQWAKGAFQSETIEETALANTEAVAKVNKLEELIDLTYEQFREVLTDDK